MICKQRCLLSKDEFDGAEYLLLWDTRSDQMTLDEPGRERVEDSTLT